MVNNDEMEIWHQTLKEVVWRIPRGVREDVLVRLLQDELDRKQGPLVVGVLLMPHHIDSS
jgi:hypothetical protein